ncbi:MAG TPA: hypothetical protein VF789_12340 [Thermoanaerobaculia bacterium]
MSLISEALKKARQEAARQDAARQSLPYAVGATETQSPRNTLLMGLAGLGAGCLLAGALFAMAYFGGWGPFAKPQAAPAPRVAQVPPPPAAVPSAPVQIEPAPVEVQEEEQVPAASTPPAPVTAPPPQVTPEAQPSIEIRPATPEPQPEPVPVAPPPAPVEEERPAAPAPAPDPAPAAPAGGLVEGRTYTGEVPVPGGGVVRLNGIAFSQERPVVVLDGRVMGTGEVVQGFTVVEIEAGRVKLQGHGATVYVSPK